jgi:hypothetical protein
MDNLLKSSQISLARAKTHVANFKREIEAFEETQPHDRFIEPDVDRPEHFAHKIKLVKPFPYNSFIIHLADAVGNLRQSLDQIAYATAAASGKIKPKSCAFPFANNAAKLEEQIKGRSADVPRDIQAVFRSFQPYRGGNDLLWTLNEIRNRNNHTILVPIGVVANNIDIAYTINDNMTAPGSDIFLPKTPGWDSTRNEIIVAVASSGMSFGYQVKFTLFVAFHEVETVEGQEASGVLDALAKEVEKVLSATEAVGRRTGLFS